MAFQAILKFGCASVLAAGGGRTTQTRRLRFGFIDSLSDRPVQEFLSKVISEEA